MKLLAIDTALSACAAAVLVTDSEPALLHKQSANIGRGHAEHIMAMVADVMAEASVSFNELDRIAVNVGPGSFTGLRVGLSIARGFGLVLQCPLISVGTLQGIAHQATTALAESNDHTAGSSQLLVALDARRDEVYTQSFSISAGEIPEPLCEPSVATVSELASQLSPQMLLAGSAAQALASEAGIARENVLTGAEYADIGALALVGAAAPLQQHKPAPLYLRPPDAIPGSKGKVKRQ
ncbi:tRNA (adenosine(37)-N6)-threonylcarbamoyltransferase complex dimerization subunit type 1 TsaB [Polycladidibacter hongkongensis]|uniref:tRNA (adenosine(37)-N6)-threonylcarbamoyltransferase complex dimerization subunit type 1 TsaB n=1 Tax=Polycladidibacter hongkongensis TaxID=1647556 RepID=UPI000829F6D8|nr:tRNA (adenosine(37)-N6)-threonylcarbamoyltransferase complex dimerization subunit type 1 TsaB [Pseudovibrio hongkongensis]